ncbi:MAG TPA: HAMP domain-containing histidine kinase [Actinobacteria bacterium]|nr:HAMP domain-containing histidine kinase [Actinomycetota bacterium]
MRQVEALTEVLDAKDQFIASVSHELRTPLTGVLGFAEVLRDQAARLSPDERDEMVAAIADEASDLARIIDDLLVMGRAEHGTLTVVAVPVDLRAQAAQVLEGLNLAAEIPIEVTLPDARAVADPGRVRQIIRNLVTNAVVYGGPNIRVIIEPVGETLVVKVIDDGAGIPPEDSEKIFQPYYRSHTTAGRPGSIGLGLSVSRMLAQRMGGDLSHRLADGETIFQLTLPAKAPRSDSPGLTDVTDTPKIRRSRDRSASTRPRTYQS